jgi:cytochrome c oxidase subunit 4
MHTERAVVAPRVYYIVFAVLMLCTYLTVQIAYFDLGALNTVAALLIAALKATLVLVFFMHVAHGARLVRVVIFTSLLFLALLLFITMGDYLTRTWTLQP